MKRWWPGIVLLIFFAGLGAFFVAGYRLGPGLKFERLLPLTITDLPQGATVYMDNRLEPEAREGALTVALLPGSHTVLAGASGYWPWKALVALHPTGSTTISAFLVPISPSVRILQGSEAAAARSALAAYTLPSAANPLLLGNGCTSLSVSDNRLVAEATSPSAAGAPSCTPPSFLCIQGSCAPTIVFAPVEQISSVLPYPHRDDALLVSAGSHVYALALDPRDPRTFAPIMQSPSPKLAPEPDGSIVGKDGATIFAVSFP